MCGISGVAWTDPARLVEPSTLDRMTDILSHRGPNGRGTHVEPGVGLGVRRLAIIDPEGGDQPIANEDGTVVLVCNGEIYDHVETRKALQARGHRFATGSDAEVIVHLYEEHGPDLVHHLRGMFAFALWDRPRRRLLLARDRIGIKPLHYAETGDGLVFGSEFKAILASGLVEPALDPAALVDILTTGMIRTPRTLLRGIGQLEPGEILVHESGRVTRRRYWTIDFPEDGAWTTRTRPEWKEAFTAELHDSVRLRMRSDVPLGSWLSAGLDSSAVAALVAGWRPGPLDTFSLRFEDAECDEFEGIRALFDFPEFDLRSHQARCEAAHLELLPDAIWFSEDPSADAGSIARMLTSELAASRVRVVVTGEGADELLGGYHWYAREAVLRRAAALAGAGPRAAVHRSVGGRIGWVARLITTAPEMGAARYAAIVGPMSPVLPGELLADPDGPVEPAPELPPGIDRERYESWSPFNQLQAWDLGVRLPDSILKHVDRASMAYGLEARVPFLDHRLLELCASMPPAMKSGDGKMGKQVLRDSLEGTLPDEIRMREKRGLRTPDDAWMAGPLPDFASELLSSGEVASRGYFRPDSVERVCEMHRSGRAEAGKILLAVLTVHLFDDIFLRGAGPGEALL